MDGLYQINGDSLNEYLSSWIDKVISQKLWEKFSDLHINEIGPEFKDQKNWIHGGLNVLKKVDSMIEGNKYRVLLAVPLSVRSTNRIKQFREIIDVQNELDLTPPSIFLYPIGATNYEATLKDSESLDFLSQKVGMSVFYNEIIDVNEIYSTIYFLA